MAEDRCPRRALTDIWVIDRFDGCKGYLTLDSHPCAIRGRERKYRHGESALKAIPAAGEEKLPKKTRRRNFLPRSGVIPSVTVQNSHRHCVPKTLTDGQPATGKPQINERAADGLRAERVPPRSENPFHPHIQWGFETHGPVWRPFRAGGAQPQRGATKLWASGGYVVYASCLIGSSSDANHNKQLPPLSTFWWKLQTVPEFTHRLLPARPAGGGAHCKNPICYPIILQ